MDLYKYIVMEGSVECTENVRDCWVLEFICRDELYKGFVNMDGFWGS